MSDTYPDVLSKAIVVDHIDRQSIAFAQQVFSKEVEDVLNMETHLLTKP